MVFIPATLIYRFFTQDSSGEILFSGLHLIAVFNQHHIFHFLPESNVIIEGNSAIQEKIFSNKWAFLCQWFRPFAFFLSCLQIRGYKCIELSYPTFLIESSTSWIKRRNRIGAYTLIVDTKSFISQKIYSRVVRVRKERASHGIQQYPQFDGYDVAIFLSFYLIVEDVNDDVAVPWHLTILSASLPTSPILNFVPYGRVEASIHSTTSPALLLVFLYISIDTSRGSNRYRAKKCPSPSSSICIRRWRGSLIFRFFQLSRIK